MECFAVMPPEKEKATCLSQSSSVTKGDKNGKIFCEQMYSFDDTKRELWLQFATKEEFEEKEQAVYELLHDSDGKDSVVIYISSIKAMNRLPESHNIRVNDEIVNNLTNFLGKNNVKVVEKNIEKRAQRY